MNIITIDSSSSSDEDPGENKSRIMSIPKSSCLIITPREFEAGDGSSDESTNDSSSISSHDSIWDKGIISSRAAPESLHTAAEVHDKFTTQKHCIVGNDYDEEGGNENSLSSADSIWDKVGMLSIGHNKSSPDEYNRDKAVCNTKSQDDGSYGNSIQHDQCLAPKEPSICDSSSISSDDSILHKAFFERKRHSIRSTTDKHLTGSSLVPPSFSQKEEEHESDDCSVSSADSMLKKTFFERKKLPIHSYYDYCKHYPNNSKNTTTETVPEVVARKQQNNVQVPPELPIPTNAKWQIVLLMDHREFGCANNFLQSVETQINSHFGGKHAEITTLPSADYLYVARLISTDHHNSGEILDERVLDMVIERKAVQDVCQCLITDSKKYKPLSFFEAQMYKLMNCGMGKKLFIMEGDEEKTKGLMHGAKSQGERERRLKRVKTLRLQLANGEFDGVDLICTKGRNDTIKFLIHQLRCFQESFDPRRPPLQTREHLKNYINRQMKSPTFLEYLRLRSIPSIGDVKAMRVIMDSKLDWDKNFISPASSKKSKASLEDKAIFWKAPTFAGENRAKKASLNNTPSNIPTPKPSSNKITSFLVKDGKIINTEATVPISRDTKDAVVSLIISDDEKENVVIE